ncbi:MAG: dihydropteroate synthase [Aestuariibacter sp.]
MTLLHTIENSKRPLVMGILNTTPDSFSDGGKNQQLQSAIDAVADMVGCGVDIIDVGGESTRPGADVVSLDEELQRTLPVIEAIKARFDVYLSIDTYKAVVMTEAANAGADLINDVKALRAEGALQAAAATELPVCLMHMQGAPQNMQKNPQYQDILQELDSFFVERIQACEQAGIARQRLILDPGFGFGKTLDHNFQLLSNLQHFDHFSLPILAGLSRKSMFGNLLQREVTERLAGSLAGAVIAAQSGAAIIRVHDVKETVDALTVLQKVQEQKFN